jgi:ribosome-associated protein
MLEEYRSGDRATPRTHALINQVSSGAAALPLPPLTGQEPEGGSLVHIVMASLEDTTLIDLHGKTSIADAMIVTTGRSSVHVNAIADRVLRAIKTSGYRPPRIEGLVSGDWVLIDAGDVIVHVFRPEVRQFYNLEKMWGADRPRPV